MKLYACHNRPREPQPLLVQDGWHLTGIAEHMHKGRLIPRRPTAIPVVRDHMPPFDISTCRYDKRATDAACAACMWREDPINEQPA